MAMNREQFFLLKLAEECTEVGQRAIKQMQFGKDEAQGSATSVPSGTNPGVVYPTNAQRLREEINDLLCTLRMLELLGEIPELLPEEFASVYAAKHAKIEKYKKYSQDLGLVEKYQPYTDMEFPL